jgi:uncharacterized RDD family membrane protein YckC
MTEQVRGGAERPPATESAPLSRRAAARLVDVGVAALMLVTVLLAFAAIGAVRGSQPPDDRLDVTGIFVVSALVTFVLYLVYEVSLVGLWGRTLGKAALGLRVERLADGNRPGLLGSLLRNLIPAVTLFAFFPAYPVSWLVQSLGWHGSVNDRLAGTRVVGVVRQRA